jgi:DNA invertase Pin-like site-specific DNA recombinase
LRAFAAKRGYIIVREYVDRDVSGKAATKPALEQLLWDAHRRDFDLVLFFSLDRLTRLGAEDAADILARIGATGCRFLSLTEPALNTLGPWSRVVIDILAIVAKMERERIRERTKAGLAIARASGKRIGRPRRLVDRPTLDAIREGRALGMSWTAIAHETGIPETSLRRAAKTVSAEKGA